MSLHKYNLRSLSKPKNPPKHQSHYNLRSTSKSKFESKPESKPESKTESKPDFKQSFGGEIENVKEDIMKVLTQTKKITQDQKDFFTSRPWWKDIHNHTQEFINTHFPDTHIVPFPDNSSIRSLIKMNEIFISDEKNLVLYEIEMSNCHKNVETLFMKSMIKKNNLFPMYDLEIYTGYALSSDGLWRNHSWIIGRSNTPDIVENIIIETTLPRLIYLGHNLMG